MTWRELRWMAEGSLRAEWDRTAVVLATLYNTRAFGGKQRVEPWQCNPFMAKRKKPTRMGDISCLKAMISNG